MSPYIWMLKSNIILLRISEKISGKKSGYLEKRKSVSRKYLLEALIHKLDFWFAEIGETAEGVDPLWPVAGGDRIEIIVSNCKKKENLYIFMYH